MTNSRKQIIINEILFWKQNKLLPEQYCDFLMTLYSEGNALENEENISYKNAIKAKEKRKIFTIGAILISIAIGLIFLLFSLEQIGLYITIVVGILAVVSIFMAFNYAKKKNLLAPLLHIFSALLILGVTVKISITYFEHNDLVLILFLILNCLLWLLTGIFNKLLYFTISGGLGILVIIIYRLFV